MKCSHCGESCAVSDITLNNYHFCCFGCKTVFQILQEHNLGNYYELAHTPGIKRTTNHEYEFLNEKAFKQQFILYEDDNISKISFVLPHIHCSSCIWLLEHLHRLQPEIKNVLIQFDIKKATITYTNANFSLGDLATLLSSIGYEPDLSPNSDILKNTSDKSILYKVGVAGFCFGNIMLLSFPEYLGIEKSFKSFSAFFGYVSLFLSIPVFFYAGNEYLKNAVLGLRQRFINMDVPIALGMITLFIRSSYEVLSQTGSGYFDSLTGLVFFLLVGKWFQQKTYKALSFERDYKSYFPMAVNCYRNKTLKPIPIADIDTGDIVVLRNEELIPADSKLLSKQAIVDYSFVTGESKPVTINKGDFIYAGGKQIGATIEIEVLKPVNSSYLTKLWNQESFTKQVTTDNLHNLSNKVSKYFTVIVLFITLLTSVYWYVIDSSTLWNATTAVLIVACPCALALSVPFTQGNLIRLLGRNGIYLKNTAVLEKMAKLNTVVLDKTGTITHKSAVHINYIGTPFNEQELILIKSAVNSSIHPLSIAINRYFNTVPTCQLSLFQEFSGKGIKASTENNTLVLGSNKFTGVENQKTGFSEVYVVINDEYKGCFSMKQHYRKGLKNCIHKLKRHYSVSLLSGDDNNQKTVINELGINTTYFNQTPFDKRNYIQDQQKQGNIVAMVGDGLNDAGALKQSDLGIVISDQVNQFSPACDIILNANQFEKLADFLVLGKSSNKIILVCFSLSFLYNVVGLTYAVQGLLSPVFAAILMPLSSISVVVLTTLLTKYAIRNLE